MSDLVRTTPVTRSTQPRDRSGESTPDQGLVWPPPDSELDSYIFPLLEPGQQSAQMPVSDSVAARTDAGQSTEPEASQEAVPQECSEESPENSPDSKESPEDRPKDRSVPEDRAGGSPSDQGFVWPPVESDLDSGPVSVEPVGVLALSTAPEHVVTLPEPEVTPAEPEVTPDTSTPIPFPLSHVLHSNVAFHWHEAVAIVRQLADQLTHGLSLEPQGSIPGVDGIALEATGRLLARLDPAGAVPVVRGLGYLLHVLLADTSAPARLRLIVSQAVSEMPTFPSVERLTWELAGFERPRRLETLKQLYERTADVRRTRRLVPATFGPDIQAVSGPVSSRTVAHATEAADDPSMRRPQLSWPALMVALAAGAVGGALVFGAVIARSPRREAAPPPQAVAESTPRALAESTPRAPAESPPRALESNLPDASRTRTDVIPTDPVRPAAHSDISPSRARGRPQTDEAVRPAMKSAPAAHEVAPPLISEPARLGLISEPARLGPAGAPRSSLREVSQRAQDLSQRAQREYRRARTLFDQKDYAKASDGFLQVVKLLDDGEFTGPLGELRSMASDYSALSRATLSAMTGGRVYNSGDEGVTEPVALRLYLPDPAPETPPSRLGVLMLVVNGEGAVESVRLQSPSNRYHDRFWVSAAKTWRFKPALKDGQPVKFLKRIVITEPPFSDPQ
jgi:hypothetical protein